MSVINMIVIDNESQNFINATKNDKAYFTKEMLKMRHMIVEIIKNACSINHLEK